VCAIGAIIAGAAAYVLVFKPTPTTESQAGREIEQTATALSLSLTLTPIGVQEETLAPSPTPSVTPSLTLSPSPSVTASPSVTPSITPSATISPSPTTVVAANPTWLPCPGTYFSRLRVGIQAHVSYDPPLANRVRSQPNIASAVLGFVQPGEKVSIIGGPICSNEWIWWQIRSLASGMTGWTAEGDQTSYWLVPEP
jgi:hypothetical protein